MRSEGEMILSCVVPQHLLHLQLLIQLIRRALFCLAGGRPCVHQLGQAIHEDLRHLEAYEFIKKRFLGAVLDGVPPTGLQLLR